MEVAALYILACLIFAAATLHSFTNKGEPHSVMTFVILFLFAPVVAVTIFAFLMFDFVTAVRNILK